MSVKAFWLLILLYEIPYYEANFVCDSTFRDSFFRLFVDAQDTGNKELVLLMVSEIFAIC